MEINLNNNQFYLILQRFNTKFKLRKKISPNPNIYLEKQVILKKAYKIYCIYSDDKNKSKENLVIKYKNNLKDEIYSLNILLEDYKDIING